MREIAKNSALDNHKLPKPYQSNVTNLLETITFRLGNTNDEGFLLKRSNFSIYKIKTLKQVLKANTLLKNQYANKGYLTKDASVFLNDTNQVTFLVTADDIAAGTITLGLDSNKGLLADTLYFEEINAIRNSEADRNVCELSKFALNPKYSSKEMIATLFQAVCIYAHNFHNATDLFCEVNPRHVAPQKRMFGFQPIGRAKICPRVNAKAVLLHLKLSYVLDRIYETTPHSKEDRSIYHYSNYTY